MAEPPKSRLDRELDEILAKKSREPIQFPSHPRAQQNNRTRQHWQDKATHIWDRLAAMPIALAFTLVVIAMLVHDFSPLLALLLNTGAVMAIWWPGVRALMRGSAPGNPDVKYWRGRPYTTEIKSTISRSPMDSIKRYFNRRR